ncbi:hypothetical protein PM082_014351 [Marasmius tenuissimus]|nr:hypothetical protein PM082_014351 [Marasmius tenuissimus]
MALSASNFPPSSDEELRAQSEYNTSSMSLDELELQIQTLSASLASLEKARAHMAQRKRSLSSILHPIRRLPPEIFAEIFRIRTFDDVDLERRDFPGSLDTRKAPWVPSQVCCTWRLVAVSTLELWTRINVSWIRGMTLSRCTASRLESLLSLQLERSRDQPLSISFFGGETSVTSDGHIQERFLLLLCSRTSQWESARLEGDPEDLLPLCRFRGAFASSKSLELDFMTSDDWMRDPFRSFCGFEDCPSLTRFSLRGDTAIIDEANDLIPWGQITRYEARRTQDWTADLHDYFFILPKLHGMEVCTLDTYFPEYNDSVFSLHPSCKLCFLHTLVLGNAFGFDSGSATGLDALFDWLVLPALRVLRTPYAPNCSAELIGCLDRSRCSLEELAIIVNRDVSYYQEFPDDLTHFLAESALHNVHALEIWGADWIGSEEIERRMWNTVFGTLTLGGNEGGA